MAGDLIIGSFYNEELQKAYVTDDTVYKIEKVLEKRTYGRFHAQSEKNLILKTA